MDFVKVFYADVYKYLLDFCIFYSTLFNHLLNKFFFMLKVCSRKENHIINAPK